ncbi:MAG: purine-nucleoside phosphorylase [Aminobacterium sp.]|jgi:purine-nucleoside phosphorylase|uniref:purine-nucleoside phosphorylase n=1 Tax=unclassified Aminobacterium TaxID=2685012 RepID=UPI001BCF821C|nr:MULTISPECIES: purine-nucleoside phosphorylase [unclassified Aminobacterium]MDD2205868.1 purine-nucleoside phosphorylase [Aminobacterium sp.]MDD3427104.1 purine-nucleoside phosphorylase [Aminobacterium sp.]MDD3706683.1 purine-nucleoside phosphorylase [Aminobacterium sp.]MDD4228117.1 purine-nucleoside phosphorylase [Aminobacterium sp.]MDD4550862.1 purine-nucleoside phosphorylase [Aminobacterium sp.]
MSYNENILEALSYIQKKVSCLPEAVLVLGSGLGGLADSIEDPIIVPYKEIPHWPLSTAPGHAGRLVFGLLDNTYVAVMQGRIHFYEGYSMKDVTFPVRVFGEWGVPYYLASNASGGINLSYLPGDMVMLYDHINFMGTNPLVGPVISAKEERFPDMSYTYDRDILRLADEVAKENNLLVHRGVYIAFSGPSYETPAEIRMARVMGADVVGMSTVPETIVAHAMGMKVFAVSCVANYAAGVTSQKLSEEEVIREMGKATGKLTTLLRGLLQKIGDLNV